MFRQFARPLVVATSMTLGAFAAQAAQLAVTSYDMPNGDGNAHAGSWNYWDANYTGSGATTTDGLSGSTLSGGTGKLTDGHIATSPWYLVSNSAGTGDYVGWESPDVAKITFHFANAVDISEIKLYVDNSHVGGVYAPDAVIVDGSSFANAAWASASYPELIDLTGLAVHGNSVDVTLHNFSSGSGSWVFLSEAQFFGTSAVPEAGNLAMMLGGLSLFAFLARRRRG
jgi:hypothetical protein